MEPVDHIYCAKRRVHHTAIWLTFLALLGTVALATNEADVPTANWWVALIRDIGFPIVVALFLLIRVERTLSEIADSLADLKSAVEKRP